MLVQRVMWILWPAFLLAGVLEIAVFAMVDPQDLQWAGQTIDISRQGIYSLSFFVFWAVCAASSALTSWLSMAASPVKRPNVLTDDQTNSQVDSPNAGK